MQGEWYRRPQPRRRVATEGFMINCVTVTGEGVNSEQVPMRIIVQHSGKLANGLMILPTQQSNKKCIEINSIDLETSAIFKAGLTPWLVQ